MTTLIAFCALLLALFILVNWASGFRSPLVPLANIGEGVHKDATTRKLEATFASRYLIAKKGTAADEVDVCGVSDIPIGIIPDEGVAGDLRAMQNFGATEHTRLAVASAAITPGAYIVPAAAGKVRTLPTANGTYYIIGQARSGGGGDTELVEFDPCVPVQRVVAG